MEEIKKIVEEPSIKLERGKSYIGWTIKCYGEDALDKAVALDNQLTEIYKAEEK